MTRWKKSSWSEGANNCVEAAWDGRVRDSKNPAGGVLRAHLRGLVNAVKDDLIKR